MKNCGSTRLNRVARGVALAALLVGVVSVPVIGQAPEVLANEGIVGMATAKVNKDIIIAKIAATENTFDVRVNGIINLSQSRVHRDIIRAMIVAGNDAKLAARPAVGEKLDNQAVILLVASKVERPVIIAKIQNTKPAFDVSANGLVQLTQAKVPNDVIKIMVARSAVVSQSP